MIDQDVDNMVARPVRVQDEIRSISDGDNLTVDILNHTALDEIEFFAGQVSVIHCFHDQSPICLEIVPVFGCA